MNTNGYYSRAIIKREQRRKQVHRQILLLSLSVILVLFLAFPFTAFSAQASDQEHAASYKYYKSIMVEKGDTLWSIAGEYMDSHYTSTAEYVTEVIRMNSLSSSKIVAGNYLIVPYFSEEFTQ